MSPAFKPLPRTSKELARAPRAAEHLVCDHEDFVLFADGLDAMEVAFGGHPSSGRGSAHGFKDEGADGFSPFFFDQGFEFLGVMFGAVGVVLAEHLFGVIALHDG
jgi:hypothetical protein